MKRKALIDFGQRLAPSPPPEFLNKADFSHKEAKKIGRTHLSFLCFFVGKNF
jgi:hypothetical protein